MGWVYDQDEGDLTSITFQVPKDFARKALREGVEFSAGGGTITAHDLPEGALTWQDVSGDQIKVLANYELLEDWTATLSHVMKVTGSEDTPGF